MCFSATASFGAAAVLGTIGAVAMSKAKKPSHKMFAAIPLVFATQQACEGLLWLALTNDGFEPWRVIATYGFLFFAQILWPVWVPMSVLLVEQDTKHKRWLLWATGGGVVCSLIMIYRVMVFDVFAEIQNHHIVYYVNDSISLIVLSSTLYFMATVIAAFFSSIRQMKWLGILSFGSLVISRIFYKMYFISVWCFFAALLSVVVIYILKHIHDTSSANDAYNIRDKHYSS
ncbi:MAG: DUF6629 family protein [Bacteroidota bacterium]